MIAISLISCSPETFVEDVFKSDLPSLIDGADIINTLAPVSKKTGLRENILSLLRKVVSDPAKQALLQSALQELPTDSSQQNMTDEQKVEFLAMRLSTGSPAEDDNFRQVLTDIVADLPSLVRQSVSKETDKTIDFNSNDANNGAE